MKKSTKGALAAASAAVLLTGAGSTLALWTSNGSVPGGAVNTGELKMATPVCAGWMVSNGGGAAVAFDGAADKLVPGDTLTQSCTTAISAVGKNLKYTIGVSQATVTGAANPSLTATAETKNGAGDVVTAGTPATGNQTLTTVVTVAFDAAAGDATQNLVSALENLTLTANQV